MKVKGWHCVQCDVWGATRLCWACGSEESSLYTFLKKPGGLQRHDPTAKFVMMNGVTIALSEEPDSPF